MQLEDILKELKLTEHTAKISAFRDNLLTASAAALQAAKLDADAKIKEAAEKLAAAQAQIVDLTALIEAGKATLAEHQKISDDLASRAEKAMADGDVAALPAIIADAKVYGKDREKKKLMDEAATIAKQSAELAEKAKELTAKAAAL